MKIFGIGTDIVSIVRIKKSIKNKSFVSRVYNVKEISKCKKLTKSEHCFAKRFAANLFAKQFSGFISRLHLEISSVLNTLPKNLLFLIDLFILSILIISVPIPKIFIIIKFF